FPEQGWTHMHPHCYSAEGLLYVGLHLKEEKFIKAAARATKWSLDQQCDDGGIPTLYSGDENRVAHQRSDVLAQVLRLGCLALELNLLDGSYKERLNWLCLRLMQFQAKSAHPAQKGGFIYGYNECGQRLDHVNAWCTMFALQAMSMYH